MIIYGLSNVTSNFFPLNICSITHFVRLLGSQARRRNPSNSIIIAKKSARSFKTGLIFTFLTTILCMISLSYSSEFWNFDSLNNRLNTTLNNIWIAIPSNFKASLLWMLSFLCCAPIVALADVDCLCASFSFLSKQKQIRGMNS